MNNKPTVAISADFLTAYAALPRQKQGKVTEFLISLEMILCIQELILKRLMKELTKIFAL